MSLDVLIVDDNPDYIRLELDAIAKVASAAAGRGVKKVVHPAGVHSIEKSPNPFDYHPFIVSNYQAALKAVNEGNYDLYIIDGQFPRTPKGNHAYPLGVRVLREIKKKKRSLKRAIFVSSNKELLEAAKRLGVQYIINKHGRHMETEYQYHTRELPDVISKALASVHHPYASRFHYSATSSTAK